MRTFLSILRNTIPWLAIPIFGIIGMNLDGAAGPSSVQDEHARELRSGNRATYPARDNGNGTQTIYVLAVIVTPTPSVTNTPTPTATNTPTPTPTPG